MVVVSLCVMGVVIGPRQIMFSPLFWCRMAASFFFDLYLLCFHFLIYARLHAQGVPHFSSKTWLSFIPPWHTQPDKGIRGCWLHHPTCSDILLTSLGHSTGPLTFLFSLADHPPRPQRGYYIQPRFGQGRCCEAYAYRQQEHTICRWLNTNLSIVIQDSTRCFKSVGKYFVVPISPLKTNIMPHSSTLQMVGGINGIGEGVFFWHLSASNSNWYLRTIAQVFFFGVFPPREANRNAYPTNPIGFSWQRSQIKK